MSVSQITLPPIPGPVPALPQGANHDQQMAHHAAQMRRWEAEMAVLRFAQAERSIEANNRLAAAQERVADLMPQHLAQMQQLLDQPPPAPAPAAPSSGEGLTVGDVAIVKGVAEALASANRPAQG